MRESTARFLGLPVYVNPLLDPKPKIQLSMACPCSSDTRDTFNAWLLEMFGLDNGTIIKSEGAIFMGKSHFAMLRETAIYPIGGKHHG